MPDGKEYYLVRTKFNEAVCTGRVISAVARVMRVKQEHDYGIREIPAIVFDELQEAFKELNSTYNEIKERM
jgi:hypothetical protein